MSEQGSGEKVLILETDDVRADPDQPRRIFDVEKLQQLAVSIKEHGQRVPGEVTRISGRKKKPRYQIVYGERRWRACQLIQSTYRATLAEHYASSADRLEAQIVENESSEPLSVMERARGFAQLCKEKGYTVDELSRRIGLHFTTVYAYMRCMRLEESLQEELDQGRMRFQVAQALVKASPAAQLAFWPVIKGMTARRAIRYIETHLNAEDRHEEQSRQRRPHDDYKVFLTFIRSMQQGAEDFLDTKDHFFRTMFANRQIVDLDEAIHALQTFMEDGNILLDVLKKIRADSK